MDTIELPSHLRASILMKIGQEEYRRARAFLFVSASVAVFSIVESIFSVQYLLHGFYQSSFYSYLSLLFSDTDIVFAYLGEFALSLIDTIPFMWITILLATIALFLFSIRIFADNMRSGLSSNLLIIHS